MMVPLKKPNCFRHAINSLHFAAYGPPTHVPDGFFIPCCDGTAGPGMTIQSLENLRRYPSENPGDRVWDGVSVTVSPSLSSRFTKR